MATVRNFRGIAVGVAAAALALMSAPDAHAIIMVGSGAGTACAIPDSSCKKFGTEVNAWSISPLKLSLYQNSNGAQDKDTVLLILAVPNDVAGGKLTSSPITSAKLFDDYAGNPAGPGTSIGVTPLGFQGLMTANEEVYGKLGLAGNNSNSFTNFTDCDLALLNFTARISVSMNSASTRRAVRGFGANDLIDIALHDPRQGLSSDVCRGLGRSRERSE